MSAQGQSTIRRRELGHELRAVIAGANLGIREIARCLDWSHPVLSHILSGNRAAVDTDVASVLALCRASTEQRDRLLELCRDQNRRGWLQQHHGDRPTSARTLLDHERDATTITSLHLLTIPPLLRTTAYARAIASHAPPGTVAATEDFIQRCQRRQKIVERHGPPRLTVFVGETAVQHPVGDPQTMLQQMCHLIQMTRRRTVEIRVIPATAAAYFEHADSFTLVHSADGGPIVHIDGAVYTLFLEKPEQIATYRTLLSTADDLALSREDTAELFVARARDLHADTDGCTFDAALCP